MGTEARSSYLLTAVAGGFAVTLVRNETQRHSATLKSAGQNPIGLFPLSNQNVPFHHRSSTWCTVVSPLTEISRISRARVELKMNSTPVFRSAASGTKGPRAVHTTRVQEAIAYTRRRVLQNPHSQTRLQVHSIAHCQTVLKITAQSCFSSELPLRPDSPNNTFRFCNNALPRASQTI